MQKYINPLTDFGFKQLFANEHSKSVITSFINDVLNLDSPIVDLSYDTASFPIVLLEINQAFIQLDCTNLHGENVIVLLHKSGHHLIKEYLLYYSSAILNYVCPLGEEGGFTFKPIYAIGITNFNLFSDDRSIRYVSLKDHDTHECMQQLLQFVFIEPHKFNKAFKALKYPVEKWLFLFKNINYDPFLENYFEHDHIILKALEHITLSNLNESEYVSYLNSVKADNDREAELELAKYQGIEQGIYKEKVEIAKKLLAKNLDISDIVDITNLSEEQIQKILNH